MTLGKNAAQLHDDLKAVLKVLPAASDEKPGATLRDLSSWSGLSAVRVGRVLEALAADRRLRHAWGARDVRYFALRTETK